MVRPRIICFVSQAAEHCVYTFLHTVNVAKGMNEQQGAIDKLKEYLQALGRAKEKIPGTWEGRCGCVFLGWGATAVQASQCCCCPWEK